MAWIRQLLRYLCRCKWADDELHSEDITVHVDNEPILVELTSVRLSTNEVYYHEDSYCSVIPVSEQHIDCERINLVPKCQAAESCSSDDNHSSCLSVDSTEVGAVHVQCSDTEYYIL